MSASLQYSPFSKPDIMAVMEREGIALKRRGRDFWAPCPFHADKSPSFKVSSDKQVFYCFGCNEHGDVIDFIIKRHVVSFKDALSILGIRNGRPVSVDPEKEKRRQLVKAFETWRRSYYFELCDQAIEIHNLRVKARARKRLSEDLGFFVAEKLSELPLIEHQLNILIAQDEEAKFELFKGMIE